VARQRNFIHDIKERRGALKPAALAEAVADEPILPGREPKLPVLI
jgi:hypothetical protein